MTKTSPLERLWTITYSCGHHEQVWTFIGDFDYVKHHEGIPSVCSDCRDVGDDAVVTVVSATLIEPEEDSA